MCIPFIPIPSGGLSEADLAAAADPGNSEPAAAAAALLLNLLLLNAPYPAVAESGSPVIPLPPGGLSETDIQTMVRDAKPAAAVAKFGKSDPAAAADNC